MRQARASGRAGRPAVAALALVAAGLPGTAGAAQWRIAGARQAGMGGAGVACTDDSSALYWNPGAIGFGEDNAWGLHVDAGAGFAFAPGTLLQVDSVIQSVQDVETATATLQDIMDHLDAGTYDDTTSPTYDIASMLDILLNDFVGLQRADLGFGLDAGAGARLHVGRFAFGAQYLGYVDAGIVADLANLALSTAGDADANINNALVALTSGSSPLPRPFDPFPVETGAVGALIASVESTFLANGVAPADAHEFAEFLVWVAGPPDPAYPTFTFADADLSDPAVQDMLVWTANATTTTGSSLVNVNETGVTIEGALVSEYAFGLSFPLVGDALSIGASLKALVGHPFSASVNYTDFSAAGGIDGVSAVMQDILDDLTDQVNDPANETTQIGLDAGVLWAPARWLRVGLTMKNANSPEFDLPTGLSGRFTLEPQTRVGVAFLPFEGLTIAADVDVTKDFSAIATEYGRQHYSLGAEVSLAGILQLRAGTFGNLLMPDAEPGYTFGLGLRLGPVFALDLAMSLSDDPLAVAGAMTGGDFQAADLPDYGALVLSLRFNTRF